MITREQIAQLLKSISEAHYQIHSYGWGDVPDLLAREDVIYPFLMVTPSSSTYEEGYATHTYAISIADRVLKDKANEVNVDSDTHQILLDILSQIDNLMYDDVDVVKGGTITPFFDNFRHEVTGHFADVGIRVKFTYDSCAVPSDIVPLPLPPPFECADASYRVQYMNGTLIEEGTIASGGSRTINVPNPSICDDASYEVRDADGNVLYSGTIASGGSENIVVTNSTVVVRKSDNTIISSVSVLAQGSANYQVADSIITLTDTDAATLSTTNVKATDPATIVAPNGTLNVNKSDGALISGQVVKSGETKGYNVADSVAVIKDSANATLKSENIKATESENITINDSTVNVRKSDNVLINAVSVKAENTESYQVADSVVSNSDASYTANVKATDGLVLPDQQVNVNSVDEGDIPSVGTIDINITDGVNLVTPNSVGIVGRTVTVEVPSGGGSFDVDLVDRFGNAFPTKQVTANATWDLRTLTPFDWADLFLNTATGSYTTQEQNAIIDAVDSWFAAGIWQRRRVINLFTGKNAFDNSLNLCYPFQGAENQQFTFQGSPIHDSNGITLGTGNGIYINLLRSQIPLQSLNMFFYSRTNSLVAGAGADIALVSTPQTYIGARDGGIDRCLFQGNGVSNLTGTTPDSRGGFHGNYITGTNASKLIRNGNTGTPISTLTNGTQYSAHQFSMNIQFPTNRNYAGVAFGEALTDTQMQDDYTIWQTFQADFNGRQV
jgi:hypothetical protein